MKMEFVLSNLSEKLILCLVYVVCYYLVTMLDIVDVFVISIFKYSLSGSIMIVPENLRFVTCM